jgi:hypothetical protein
MRSSTSSKGDRYGKTYSLGELGGSRYRDLCKLLFPSTLDKKTVFVLLHRTSCICEVNITCEERSVIHVVRGECGGHLDRQLERVEDDVRSEKTWSVEFRRVVENRKTSP